MQTTIITVTIVEVVIDNTLPIDANKPGQPLWAAGGLYDPAMMDAYWADVAALGSSLQRVRQCHATRKSPSYF